MTPYVRKIFEDANNVPKVGNDTRNDGDDSKTSPGDAAGMTHDASLKSNRDGFYLPLFGLVKREEAQVKIDGLRKKYPKADFIIDPSSGRDLVTLLGDRMYAAYRLEWETNHNWNLQTKAVASAERKLERERSRLDELAKMRDDAKSELENMLK